MPLEEKLIYNDGYVKRKLDEINGKKVVLYGAGLGARELLPYLTINQIKPAYICDTNMEKWGKDIEGIKICSFNYVLEKIDDFVVIISAPQNVESITAYLLKFISENKIYFFMPKIQKFKYHKYINENIKKINKVYNILEDEYSKKTLINTINGKVTGNYNFFKEVCETNQYFPGDILSLSSEEVFVDVGAYIGDTIEKFKYQVDGQYEKIIAI